MPYTELLKWIEYFKRRPVGWRDDQRTSLILSSAGVKAKGEDLFPSLRAIKDIADSRSKEDRAVPKGLFLKRMLQATGGDKVNLVRKKDVKQDNAGGSELPR